jgi:hypothetical protein
VYVIRHYNERIDINTGIMNRQPMPYRQHHFPCGVQPHVTLADITKETFPSLHADGDEIGPRARIIVPPQSERTAVVLVGIVSHPGITSKHSSPPHSKLAEACYIIISVANGTEHCAFDGKR